MSLTDLRKLDLLKPEPEWTGQVPRSSVKTVPAVVTTVAGIVGCVLMAFGDGALLTWVGLAMFSVSLAVFTMVNVSAIGGNRAADRIEASNEAD
jgi:hypothetical protein